MLDHYNIITLGNCSIYRVYESEKSDNVIHRSYVIHRCYKFTFLRRDDIEIGPCYTQKEWRGKGIYPATLTYIVGNEISGKECAYMMVDTKNYSSQRGVIKAGFEMVGEISKSKMLKIYKIIDKM